MKEDDSNNLSGENHSAKSGDGGRKRKSTKVLNKIAQKELRRHLDERLQSLYRRALIIERQLQNLNDPRFFRVCIFGSARIKSDTKEYKQVVELASLLAGAKIDILTGGGPGLMEAANLGAKAGQGRSRIKSRSFGLPIELEWEDAPNKHLDVKRHHSKFSSRLDDFMRLSNAIIATPGGIGTLLEVFFSWQLVQVRHISQRPIVLVDSLFWNGLMEWMKDLVLARGLVSKQDFDYVHVVDSPEEVFEIIDKCRKDSLVK